jgi:hypothetical protein
MEALTATYALTSKAKALLAEPAQVAAADAGAAKTAACDKDGGLMPQLLQLESKVSVGVPWAAWVLARAQY